ncbi:MAG: SnoaL-like domain-containing protein, partial [Hamadaea sp.]|nr:SnoaL-like domain-containing protein [Hamadaea sp.]
RPAPPAAGSAAEDAIVARFVSAYEAADVDGLIALLTDDVFIAMPPVPFEYEGIEAAARFIGAIFGSGRRFSVVPTRANGHPAIGVYLRTPDAAPVAIGVMTLTLAGDRVCAMTRFDGGALPWFNLPATL